MAVTFVTHRVADYAAWRAVYDSVSDVQDAGGVADSAVYRAEGDPSTVLVYHRFESLAAAHAFLENPELLTAMKEGGVDETSLRVEYFEEA